MTGKAVTKVVANLAGRPRRPNMLASLRQIDPVAFSCLMGLGGIGRSRPRPMTQSTGQAVGQIATAFTAQLGQDRDIVSADDYGMAEFEFEQSRDLLMTRVTEAAGKDFAGGRIGFATTRCR